MATQNTNSASNSNLNIGLPLREPKTPDMPHELWDRTFSYLSVQEVQRTRLVCKAWSIIASRHLFPSFITLRTDRQDLERLEAIIQQPEFNVQINSLRFEVGNVETATMWDWIIPKYLSRYVEVRRPAYRIRDREIVEEEKYDAISEFGNWKTRCLNANQNYTIASRLANIFNSPKLLPLKTIEVARRATQFKYRYLKEAWAGGNQGYHEEVAIKELWALLNALGASMVRLSKFSHDQVPLAFFCIAYNIQRQLFMPLQNLTTLHLSLDTIKRPSLAFWTGLRQSLLLCPHLEDLQLGFTSLKTSSRPKGLWCYDKHDIKLWYVSLRKLFNGHSWPQLRKFRLDGMVVSETHLVHFANQHSESLKCVEICNMALWQGSFESLLTSLRDMMVLKGFHIWGRLYACHPLHAEHWEFLPTHDNNPECWTPEFSAFVSRNPYATMDVTPGEGLGEKLEEFVLSGGPWPMAGISYAEIFPHSSRCGEECPDAGFVNEWETQWDESDHVDIRKREWENFTAAGFEDVEPMEDKHTEQCDANGRTFYNGHAFNRLGYDEHDIHYERYFDHYDEVDEGISTIAVRKELLHEMLQHIPQYAGQAHYHGSFLPPPWDPYLCARAYYSIFASS